MTLLVVCTGNTCRSVMAGAMLAHLASTRDLPLTVVTAGTHAVGGVPLGARTLGALRTILPSYGTPAGASSHRSTQLGSAELGSADLVVAMEAAHVRFVRRHHPQAAARTGMLRTLVRDLPPGPAPLPERVATLQLDRAVLDDADDAVDPAGLDDAVYASCAADLWATCSALVARL
jgi:protein-tyrosine-phosphatase